MIIKLEQIQDACAKMSNALDANVLSVLSETLELKTEGTTLLINVTNREYFATVRVNINEPVEFHATVNANLFLKLISQITTETVELSVDGTTLYVKGNGKYKLPLIFDGDHLMELPPINIVNTTAEFDVKSAVLKSILDYNSKELVKGAISSPIQRLYYIDDKGAITFTSGACVNEFTLAHPVKMLLNDRIVRLFKLFKETDVHFVMGHDPISETIVQTKVAFSDKNVSITAILSCDDSMITGVPVEAIRGRASNQYPYTINVDKDAVLETIGRMMLFSDKGAAKLYATVQFNEDNLVLYDVHKDNNETVYYSNSVAALKEPYTAVFDLIDLKLTLENCSEKYVTISFGDHQAAVFSRASIKNIIPEC